MTDAELGDCWEHFIYPWVAEAAKRFPRAAQDAIEKSGSIYSDYGRSRLWNLCSYTDGLLRAHGIA